jgi:5'-nucleotidase
VVGRQTERMRRSLLAPLAALSLLLAACGNDDAGSAATTTTTAADTPAETTTTEPGEVEEGEVLRILASNDDGIEHPGLDLMVRTLMELDDVEVTVVAPAENQSGTSDRTTEGGASHAPGSTASGIEGTAVDGFPADAVLVALDELGLEPHLVVSGINDAQNIGPFAELSGTVGVVRTSVRRGIPGIAVSAGLEYNDPEFEVGAALVVEWIEEHRDQLLAGTYPLDHAVSINVPTCDVDDMGDLVEVPLAAEFIEGVGPFEFGCDLAVDDPEHDHRAVHHGYPSLTRVPPEL